MSRRSTPATQSVLAALTAGFALAVLTASCGKYVEAPPATPAPPPHPQDGHHGSGHPPDHGQEPSLPPGYGSPHPPPPPEVCAGCSYIPVYYGSAARDDYALLCAHRPDSPVKPIDERGTLHRDQVTACDRDCCDRR